MWSVTGAILIFTNMDENQVLDLSPAQFPCKGHNLIPIFLLPRQNSIHPVCSTQFALIGSHLCYGEPFCYVHHALQQIANKSATEA